VQIQTPAVFPAGLGPGLSETGRLPEVDAEQELLDGFLAKLQAIIRGEGVEGSEPGESSRS
jgi:hypothetical protein